LRSALATSDVENNSDPYRHRVRVTAETLHLLLARGRSARWRFVQLPYGWRDPKTP
jgi:hypothetical protein